MNSLEETIKKLANTGEEIHSEIAIVTKTYRVKDVNERNEVYSAVKHLTCDVKLASNNNIVYSVRLSPEIITNDSTVFDGTSENQSGDVQVNVPLINSYVIITWLNDEDAFVSLSTKSESIIIGGSNGAYIDLYNNAMSLINIKTFTIQLSDGKTFEITNDSENNVSELVAYLGSVLLEVDNSQLELNSESISLSGTKIVIKNNADNIADILNGIIDEFISYLNIVSVGLAAAVPPVVVAPTIVTLNALKVRVSGLFG